MKDDKRKVGARKQNYKSHYSNETGKNTKRNVFKGSDEIGWKQLARGIYESQDTNYKEEELIILENNVEIQKMIKSLEEKQDKKDDKIQT